MKCSNCNYENPTEFSVCPNCKEKYFQSQELSKVNRSYDVEFLDPKLSKVYSFTGKGKITIDRMQIVLFGYNKRYWHYLVVIVFALLTLPEFYFLTKNMSSYDLNLGEFLGLLIILIIINVIIISKIVMRKTSVNFNCSSIKKINLGSSRINIYITNPKTGNLEEVYVEFDTAKNANEFAEIIGVMCDISSNPNPKEKIIEPSSEEWRCRCGHINSNSDSNCKKCNRLYNVS